MARLSGTINVAGVSPEIPEGCVAFIYLMQEEKVVGHQTVSKLSTFPFEFSLDVTDEPVRENSDYSLRVTVEQGESILWANSGVPIAKGSLPSNIEIAVTELNLR
jgi:hypothetical protein